MTGLDPDPLAGVRAIADLLAWARRLSDAGHHADPADRAAFHTAKAALFARLDHSTEQSTKDVS